MKCKEAQQLISPWIDDELSESQQTALQQHLDECEVCRFYQHELTQSLSSLKCMLNRSTSPDFNQRVLQTLSEQPEHPDFLDWLIAVFQPGWRQISVSIAGAVVFIAFSLFAAGLGPGSPVWNAPASSQQPVICQRPYLQNNHPETCDQDLAVCIDFKRERLQRWSDDLPLC